MTTVIDFDEAPMGKKQIICQVCNKSFKRGKDLKSHSVIHIDAKPFVCSECPEAFKHKASLKRHSLIHSGEKPFTCRICAKSFRQKGALNEHLLTHSGARPHTCEICNMGFTTKGNYGRHLKKHFTSKPFTCNVCDKAFNLRAYLTRHYKTHHETSKSKPCKAVKKVQDIEHPHEEQSKSEVADKKSPELYSPNVFVVPTKVSEALNPELVKYLCKLCTIKFEDYNELKIHLQSHLKKKVNACDTCKKQDCVCKDRFSQNQEILSQDDCFSDSEFVQETNEDSIINIYSSSSLGTVKIKKQNKSQDRKYLCKVCEKTFLKRYQFVQHSYTHKYPGPYCCDICNDDFNCEKLNELHKHYTTKHGEVKCFCYNCMENELTDGGDTNVNYSKSTFIKCVVCYKCFPDKNLLQVHFFSHRNKKPFVVKLDL